MQPDRRLSDIIITLEKKVSRIPDPRLELEQYTTPADLAVKLALHAKLSGVLDENIVLDLGAGTCRLALAALLLGAMKAIAVDADARLSSLCIDAARELNLYDRLLFVNSWISRDEGPIAKDESLIVLMNPPFGVHRRGSDTEFILYSLSLMPKRVYAILKSGNLDYHQALAISRGYEIRLLWRDSIDIPASMKHHRSRVRRVEVDVVCFQRKES